MIGNGAFKRLCLLEFFMCYHLSKFITYFPVYPVEHAGTKTNINYNVLHINAAITNIFLIN